MKFVQSSDAHKTVSSNEVVHRHGKRPQPVYPGIEQAGPNISIGRRKWLFIAVSTLCLVYLTGLWHYAQVRPVDGDEGYYATAARLVWEGKILYRDFAYPQGPLLPYLYSWIWAIHPRSLMAMRFFSVVCGSLAVLLWGWALLSLKVLPTKVAFACFLAVLLNPYWVSWNVVIKTFAVANLLMTIVMISFYLALKSGRSSWYIVAGLALGACASVRLLYAPLVPLVLAWLFYKDWQSSRSAKRGLRFLVGAICGLSPMIVTFIGDPQAFIFNNLRYHPLLASHVSLRHTIHLYANIALSLLQAKYFMVELVLVIVGGLTLLRNHKRVEPTYTPEDIQYFQLAMLMLFAYVAAALVPFPPFDQYFDSPLVPFAVPFLAEGLRTVFNFRTRCLAAVSMLVLILFVADVNRDAVQCSSAPSLQLSSYRKVAEVVMANSKPDDTVLSFWPGYIFESGRRYFAGSEDKFNYSISSKMTSQERYRYHVVSRDSVVGALTTRAVGLVITYPRVFDKQDDNTSSAELEQFHSALNAGYVPLAKIDDVGIYQRKTLATQQLLLSK